MTEEIYNDMEFLIQELHKEWGRSGEAKYAALLNKKDIQKLVRGIVKCIENATDKTPEVDMINGMSFREYIRKSKEYSILMRLAEKVKILNDMIKKRNTDTELWLWLDDEESELFLNIFTGGE